MYEYSFLNEWVGHTASALGGMYYGGKFGYKIGDVIGAHKYYKYLQSDDVVMSESLKMLDDIQKTLKAWIDVVKRMDEQIQNEKESGEDTYSSEHVREVYAEQVDMHKKRIREYKIAIAKRDYNVLRKMLLDDARAGYTTQNSAVVQDTPKNFMNGGVVLGGITGGVGYHYAKKGIKRLLKK